MPEPHDPGPGEVTVKLRAVGICGSDMHWYLEGCIGSSSAIYPQVLGHEPAGEVIAAGSGVSLRAGDRVVVEPSITCGHCEFCLRGRHNNCVQSIFMGSPQHPGLFREYATIPARNAVRFPDSLSYSQATLIEPLAVILHVLELVDIHVGDTVAVLGAGPIGMLCASVARLAGASQIFAGDIRPYRLELARGMGAGITVDTSKESMLDAVMDHTRGRGVDLVLDAAGAADSINTAIAIARLSGRVALIGIPSERMVPVDLNAAMAKELDIQTIKRSNHNAHEAIELLRQGRVADALVTHRLPLEQTAAAFNMLANYSDGVGKAVIEIG
jgi:L-iditol 2-dehydrogenase